MDSDHYQASPGVRISRAVEPAAQLDGPVAPSGDVHCLCLRWFLSATTQDDVEPLD